MAILRSSSQVFCAGADLKEIAAGNIHKLFTNRGGFAGLVKSDRRKPVIGAVNGAAVAGGCEIALACKMIIAGENARFGLPEVKRSLVPGAGGLFRLPRSVGLSLAMEMILTGDTIDATQVLSAGLVNKVLAVNELMGEALSLAKRIAINAPLAVQASRIVASRAMTDSDEALWPATEDALDYLTETEDFLEDPLLLLKNVRLTRKESKSKIFL